MVSNSSVTPKLQIRLFYFNFIASLVDQSDFVIFKKLLNFNISLFHLLHRVFSSTIGAILLFKKLFSLLDDLSLGY